MIKLRYPLGSRVSFENLDLFLDEQVRNIPSKNITILLSKSQLEKYLVLQNIGLGNAMTLKQANFCGVKLAVDNPK